MRNRANYIHSINLINFIRFIQRNTANKDRIHKNGVAILSDEFQGCISFRGHPHSTYAQRERGGAKPNANDCVLGGRGSSRLRTYAKKMFLDHKISKLFFFV